MRGRGGPSAGDSPAAPNDAYSGRAPGRGGAGECPRHTGDGRGRVACLGSSGPPHPPHSSTFRNRSQLRSRGRRGLDAYPRNEAERGKHGGRGGGGKGLAPAAGFKGGGRTG